MGKKEEESEKAAREMQKIVDEARKAREAAEKVIKDALDAAGENERKN